MSLARAFTKRAKRPADLPEPLPNRGMSTRKHSQSINRNLISSPVELLSTTNTLAYNAPDLPNATLRHVSTSSNSSTSSMKKRSMDDSDMHLTSPDLTDASSIDSGSPTSPKPNHLSSYFAAANSTPTLPVVPPPPAAEPSSVQYPRRAASTTSLIAKSASTSRETSPVIPQRARAHSKTAHEQIAMIRSMHSMQALRDSHDQRSSREQRASVEMFRAPAPEHHPFGKELEQLNEVVAEFGNAVAAADMDEDIIVMRNHGLSKFSAMDYMSEIQPLFGGLFTPRPAHGRKHFQPPPVQMVPDNYGWI